MGQGPGLPRSVAVAAGVCLLSLVMVTTVRAVSGVSEVPGTSGGQVDLNCPACVASVAGPGVGGGSSSSAHHAAASGSWGLLFDTSDFPPRWQCGHWSALLGWSHILADLAIFAAYTAIPLALAYFIRRRDDIPFTGIFWLFSAFIFACGFTHLIEASIFWWPAYRVSAVAKVATAAVSWITVLALLPVLPKALALPGLVSVNNRLAVEVRDRRLAQDALRQANELLERRNAEMEQFIYTVSHDLRSPIVTQVGFLECMRRDLERGRTDQLMDHLQRVKRAADRMNESIGELLELSRLGRIELHPQTIHVRGSVEELLQELQERVAQAGVKVKMEFNADDRIHADPLRVAQVYQNLVTNALKYARLTPTGEPGTLRIGCRFREGEIWHYVADDGPGIDPKYHHKAFELFQRLDTSQEGTGIGLTTVARLMEVMGGHVKLESDVDAGATFWLRFPRTAAQISPAATQQPQGA